MIKITVDDALAQVLSREGRRDPLLQETFHVGDTISQCPACKSWMLAQSWEALNGSCACSYQPGTSERIQVRRNQGNNANNATAPGGDAAPPESRTRFLIGWGAVIALLVGVVFLGLRETTPPPAPAPEPPAPTPSPSPPTPTPPRSDPPTLTRKVFTYWTMTEIRPSGATNPESCEAATVPRVSDGVAGAGQDRSIIVEVKDGYVKVRVRGPYSQGSTTLQVHGSSYRLGAYTRGLFVEENEILRAIDDFRAGAEATVSGGSTTDLYSLYGFTAAYDAALRACNSR